MPYIWHDSIAASGAPGAVLHQLTLWPHRSLPRGGFVAFIGTSAVLVGLPLLAVVGSPVLWGLLPFAMLAIGGVWWGIGRTYRSGEAREQLRFDAQRLELVRSDPGRPDRRFEANPYWVRVALRPGPVENYLTLSGDGREVELGAFLTPDERGVLEPELRRRLRALREERGA